MWLSWFVHVLVLYFISPILYLLFLPIIVLREIIQTKPFPWSVLTALYTCLWSASIKLDSHTYSLAYCTWINSYKPCCHWTWKNDRFISWTIDTVQNLKRTRRINLNDFLGLGRIWQNDDKYPVHYPQKDVNSNLTLQLKHYDILRQLEHENITLCPHSQLGSGYATSSDLNR